MSNVTGSAILESLSILEALRGLGRLGRELGKELSKYFRSRKTSVVPIKDKINCSQGREWVKFEVLP